MSISTATARVLFNIVSFLREPVRGGTKELQFAQLISDRIFLLKLKQMNLPLFPFLNDLSIAFINKNLKLTDEFDRINRIFKQIYGIAKRSLIPKQFTEICTQHASRCISRYTEMNATNNQNNQDHAICALATALRNEIPNIPTTPKVIRAGFADPRNQGTLNTIKTVHLSNQKLQCLPPEIGKLEGLTRLLLGNNKILELPTGFCNLRNVRYLHLENNNLSELPGNFANLINLQQLDLSNNNLSKLPGNFGNLINLQALNLNNNNLSEVPVAIYSLVHLMEVFLEDNFISKLPSEMNNFLNERNFFMGNQKTPLTSSGGGGSK